MAPDVILTEEAIGETGPRVKTENKVQKLKQYEETGKTRGVEWT